MQFRRIVPTQSQTLALAQDHTLKKRPGVALKKQDLVGVGFQVLIATVSRDEFDNSAHIV